MTCLLPDSSSPTGDGATANVSTWPRKGGASRCHPEPQQKVAPEASDSSRLQQLSRCLRPFNVQKRRRQEAMTPKGPTSTDRTGSADPVERPSEGQKVGMCVNAQVSVHAHEQRYECVRVTFTPIHARSTAAGELVSFSELHLRTRRCSGV